MDIIRIIERKFGRLLGREAPGRTIGAKDSPPAAVRVCQFGHTVFDGNNLCNYCHGPA
jgi:hypothetical protein